MESLHPLIVHFPIALLITATALDLIAVVWRRPGLHRVALWNLYLGTLGAACAVLSGWQAEGMAKHTYEIHEVMERHERLGYATLALGAVVIAWRLWRRDQLAPRSRLISILLMLAIVGTLAYGAHLGGRMVYELGVGGSFGRSASALHDEPQHH